MSQENLLCAVWAVGRILRDRQEGEVKIILMFVGVVTAVFGVAQLLQLLGLFGVGFSIAGIGITVGAFAISIFCFRRAFKVSDKP